MYRDDYNALIARAEAAEAERDHLAAEVRLLKNRKDGSSDTYKDLIARLEAAEAERDRFLEEIKTLQGKQNEYSKKHSKHAFYLICMLAVFGTIAGIIFLIYGIDIGHAPSLASGIHFLIASFFSFIAINGIKETKDWKRKFGYIAFALWTLTICFPIGLYGLYALSRTKTSSLNQ